MIPRIESTTPRVNASSVEEPRVYRIPTIVGGEPRELRVEGEIAGSTVSMLVDTGSMISLVSRRLVGQFGDWGYPSFTKIRLADGTELPSRREGDLELVFQKRSIRQKFVEVELEEQVILGMDFLQNVRAILNIPLRRMRLLEFGVELEFSGDTKTVREFRSLRVDENGSVDLSQRLKIEFPGVFGDDKSEFGRTTLVRHRIVTGEALPVRQRPRRLPAHQWDIARKEIEKMKKLGVIEESKSPWCAPVVLVPKKSGEVRFCVDYRGINAVTKKDSYPLPNLTEMLERLGESRWFSVLDLRSGYWQIEMDPKDKEKTAFSIGAGLWQFTVMPFGLCNAVATFQRLMERVLDGLVPNVCMVYVDDIIVHAKTREEGERNVRLVVGRLSGAGLTLAEKKCEFLKAEVKFLGHVVTDEGVKMDPEKLAAVTNWPEPQNVKDLRGFLGLATYYRKFVHRFAELTFPLNKLLRKNEPFIMGKDQRLAIKHLVNALTQGPILAQPDLSKTFILDTDASDTGIGAVLSQIGPQGEKVVAYFSKSLSRSESNYCTTRKELLALVKSVKHFRYYLLGKVFQVRTDHSALQWLRSFKEPEGQVARWLEYLQEYEFVVSHRKGLLHSNADSLSRRPCVGDDCRACSRKEKKWEVRNVQVVEDIRGQQAQDADITLIIRRLNDYVHRPTREEMGPMNSELLTYWLEWASLQVRDGVLYRRREKLARDVWQWVVPRDRRKGLLEEAHAGRTTGHLGSKRTFERLRARAYWPGYRLCCENFCRSCIICAKRNSLQKKAVPPMGVRVVGRPFERIAVDILGPLPRTTSGHRYILVIGDYFTKWMEAYPLVTQEATEVATKICEEYFCRYGIPGELHSDQGRSFECTLLREICNLMGVKKTRTTPFHPQSDGLIERFNRTLADMLAKVVDLTQVDWDEKLPYALLAYRSSVNSSTGYSPSGALWGFEPRLPLDMLVPKVEGQAQEYSSFVTEHHERLTAVRERILWNLKEVSRKMKTRYDKGVHQVVVREGDQVYLWNNKRTKGLSPKLQNRWEGPFRVVRAINDRLVELLKGRRKFVVHRSLLKLVV